MANDIKQKAFVIQQVDAPLYFKNEHDRRVFNSALRNLVEHESSQVSVVEKDGSYELTLKTSLYPATAYQFFLDWSNYPFVSDPEAVSDDPMTALMVVATDGKECYDQWFFLRVRPMETKLVNDGEYTWVKLGFVEVHKSPSVEEFAKKVIGAIQVPLFNFQRGLQYLTNDHLQSIVNVTLKPNEPSLWRKLTHHLNAHDYPTDQIAQYGGIPENMVYDYVSSSFLNGLVNYAGIKQAFLINRYGPDRGRDRLDTLWSNIDESLPHEEQYRIKAENLAENPHLNKFGTVDSDDTVLFGETDYDWWIFYYDCDCSDCSVIRISKGSDWENDLGIKIDYQWIVEQYLADLKARYNDWAHDPTMSKPLVVEIKPKNGRFGWIGN